MSGAEAGLVIGLISGIISIVEATWKIYVDIKDTKCLPRTFHQTAETLPLVEDTLQTAKGYMDEHDLPEESRKAMKHILEGCKSKVGKLQQIFEEISPQPEDSRFASYRKVACALGKGSRVETLMDGILKDVTTLVQNHGIKAVTKNEFEVLTKAIQDLKALPSSLMAEDSPAKVSHSGSGDIQYAEGHIIHGNHNENHGSGPAYFGNVTQHGPTMEGRKTKLLGRLFVSPYEDRKERNPQRVEGTYPGCGKSVLAKYLVDDRLKLSNTPNTICYFFFKDDFEDQRSPEYALCCILHQLFRQRPELLTEEILREFESGGENIFSSFTSLWRILISSACRYSSGVIVCVLDALDECKDTGRRVLLSALNNLYISGTGNFNLKFLVTSRPYFNIEREFQTLKHQCPTIHLNGENETVVDQISTEIDLVIKKRVEVLGAELDLQKHETPLCHAATMGHEDVVETLLDKTFHVNCKDRHNETPLSRAAMNGYETISKLLINKGARIDRKNDCGDTPLVQAAYYGHLEVARLLVDRNASYDNCCAAVSVAASSGHEAIVRLLLDRGASINGYPNKRWPLDGAAAYGHEAVVRLLVERGANVGELHRGSLVQACDGGNEAIVRLLLDRGASTDGFPEEVRPLLAAAAKGHEAIVRLLLERGIDVDEPEDSEEFLRRPLQEAANKGHVTVVRLLLDRGANVDGRNGLPLERAAANQHEAIVRLLLERGANVDGHEGLPLERATRTGNEAIVRLLVERGAKLDGHHGMPLHGAIASRNEAIVHLLLERGANADGGKGYPLEIAATTGNQSVVRLLIEKGADPDGYGGYPLERAAGNNMETVVRILLDSGANVHGSKYSPLHAAVSHGCEATVRLLLERGANVCVSEDSSWALFQAAKVGDKATVKLVLDSIATHEARDRLRMLALASAEKSSWYIFYGDLSESAIPPPSELSFRDDHLRNSRNGFPDSGQETVSTKAISGRHSNLPGKPTHNRVFNHVAVSVCNIESVVKWYSDILGFRLLSKIHHIKRSEKPDDAIFGIYPASLNEVKLAWMTTGNGVGFEVFEFIDPKAEPEPKSFEFHKAGFFHICVTDPDPDALAAKIVEAGGRRIGNTMDPLGTGVKCLQKLV
ncbi:hypothetical protein G7Z17_g7786 [Cylindrodendrum hubeiense]|uniref:VOC domain-containing protein n=1 Tax=Cylindrodendrum hubeiense TaxID=595255 RepID=A0A9P5H8E7_9HYPO|nr:hypothetical protein G7Z17_g7786 [Cylindrodendrum hubeiense]